MKAAPAVQAGQAKDRLAATSFELGCLKSVCIPAAHLDS